MQQTKKNWLPLILATGAILITGFLIYLFAKLGMPIPCLFYEITGLRCPGCGNSRAVFALLRMDFPSMLQYNFLFPIEMGYLLWVYFRSAWLFWKKGFFAYRPAIPALDWLFLSILILWWVLRNFLQI